jgi:L-cysteine desulfidase
MNVLKEVLKNEVFPALGCTEPIAVAYAASLAAAQLEGEIREIQITVDPGVYKNGLAVTVPNTGGEKGNLIAGVLGALIRQPDAKMEILKYATPQLVSRAQEIIMDGRAKIHLDRNRFDLYIEAAVNTGHGAARAVIESAHTNLVCLEKDGSVIFASQNQGISSSDRSYRSLLKEMKIKDLIEIVRNMDQEDRDYIKQGIEMNLAISETGQGLNKVGHFISDLTCKGYITDDIFASSKILTASATDARMAGINMPVMSSGGSGNQGIVAILVPYNVGNFYKIEQSVIIESIALSHLINSYIKCFIGDLSPLCGCAIAAGVGAASAVVYQQCGDDMAKITLAVNNLISDLGGMLCDGAKGGCALKVASSADSAIRAAYMAINNHGITEKEGFVGKTAEQTIYHLSQISKIGMGKADDTMLGIMIDKTG